MTDRTFDLDGITVHYTDRGVGEPVALVHGWPADSRLWEAQVAALAPRFRVLAIDLPGYGRSAAPARPRFGLLADAVLGLLDAAGVERAALVGHDVGGPAVLLTAIRHPERVSRLAVLDTTPYPRLPALIRLLVLAARIPGLGRALVSRPGMWLVFRIGAPAADARVLAARFTPGSAARRRVLRRALSEADPAELAEVESGLATLAMRTLVLWAERDPTGPLGLARRLHADIPGSTLVTVGRCGHFLPLDRPEVVNEVLAGFLK